MKAGLAFVCVCFLFFRTGDCTVTFSTPSGATATVTLSEGSTTIYTAVASGAATIAYTTGTQSTAGTFEIGGSTGVVALASGKELDYETAQTHTVIIIGTEADSDPAVSASVTLTVSVTDVSSTPTFTEPPFCGTVSTGDTSGTTVGTYAASVADPDETATYTFASGNTGTKFAISTAGIVTTTSAVTASDSFPYMLVLKATASVTTASTATATLTVVRDDTCSGATDHKSIAMATAGTLLLLIVSRIV